MLQFKAASAQGGGGLLLSALLAMLIAVLAFSLWPDVGPQQAWLLIFILLGLAAFVGYSKLKEPAVMLQLDDRGIVFFHKYGSWRLPWHDLAYAKVVEIEGKTLNFVGFRLSSYNEFLACITIRLALRLLIEQRPLLVAALGAGCRDGRCPTTMLEQLAEFKHNGVSYRGVLGLFAQRMDHFRTLLQLDILIPADVVGYAAEDFCRLINQQRLKSLIIKGG
ncbi:MAG: DUF2982 domain-containing protein [Rheinheimera sp.]|jgi:hypothetical protein|nr:DUF2982 domain-containing protein [Gammaproteobacteria bacterium]MDZ7903830.1 DUF2982 domain-containing protein [Rheinheimera sp.]